MRRCGDSRCSWRSWMSRCDASGGPVSNDEAGNALKVTVVRDQDRAQRKCGRGDPKIVVFHRKTRLLARSLEMGVMLRRLNGNTFLVNRAQDGSDALFDRITAPSRRQPLD